MKKFFIIFLSLTAIFACQKNDTPKEISQSAPSGEIVFNLAGDDLGLEVTTKATAVTSLSKVYWEAKSGSSVLYSVAQYSVSSNKVSTGKYWPSGGATYSYMVSNASFTTSTGAIAATNSTDIVCGTASSVTSNSCTVTLDHIFARTGTLTLNTQSGYSISVSSWKIASKGTGTGTAGTYTIGSGWSTSGVTALSSTEFSSTSDLYLIPGTYTVSVTYTLTKGAYSKTFTKSADVTLVQGKVNSITGTASGGDASQITFSVSITAWGSNSIEANFS